jgi:hypothetical protein
MLKTLERITKPGTDTEGGDTSSNSDGEAVNDLA